MSAIAFDTLSYCERAKSAGFSEQQASFQAHVLAKLIQEELVTRRFVDSRFEATHNYIDIKIDKLLLRIGGMMVVSMGIIISAIGLIIKIHS